MEAKNFRIGDLVGIEETALHADGTVLAAGWIPVDQLPIGSMKIKWLCEDGVEDVGFYYSEQEEFASWDLCSEKPITHWKPLEDILPVSKSYLCFEGCG